MRALLFLGSALAVMGLAFWAYKENYNTRQAMQDLRQLHADIASARVRINVLNAEWAYLNRPDRLRDLAEMNFDRLGLLPLGKEAFGRIDQVAFPTDNILDLENGVEVSSDNGGAAE